MKTLKWKWLVGTAVAVSGLWVQTASADCHKICDERFGKDFQGGGNCARGGSDGDVEIDFNNLSKGCESADASGSGAYKSSQEERMRRIKNACENDAEEVLAACEGDVDAKGKFTSGTCQDRTKDEIRNQRVKDCALGFAN
ncbi:MAG: hypothetical protein IT190_08420, partial [Microbacteriaceae bacterium]|nr:hypothetical protein [Microbacteriaceae bacterium]